MLPQHQLLVAVQYTNANGERICLGQEIMPLLLYPLLQRIDGWRERDVEAAIFVGNDECIANSTGETSIGRQYQLALTQSVKQRFTLEKKNWRWHAFRPAPDKSAIVTARPANT